MRDIIETVRQHDDLKTFLKIILETGLYDVLSEDGPFTLFAPTDKAFQAIPKETMKRFFNDKEQLTEMLTQHIIMLRLKSKDIMKNLQLINANGKKITLAKQKYLIIEQAQIIKKDINCANGVIHTINKVLLL